MGDAAPDGGQSGRWGDLGMRVVSGIVLAIVGIGAIWAGGHWFTALVVVAMALMVWELRMLAAPDQPRAALICAGIAALALIAVAVDVRALPILPLLAFAGSRGVERLQRVALLYGIAVLLGGWALMTFRNGFGDFGLLFIGWIVAIVVATDIAGYFAGRLLGGPKFWPRVSPKKTWSGTVAGWVAAALVSMAFIGHGGFGWPEVGLAVLVSFAGQMGDVVESAIKRAAGVKDASNLIPGHGGVMDRFDALLGAVLFTLVLLSTIGVAGQHL